MGKAELIQKLIGLAEKIDPWNMGEYVEAFRSMSVEELKEQIRQSEEWLAEYETEVA